MGNFQNPLKSSLGAMNFTNTSEFNNTMNNLRGVVKIPPYQQIVTPGVRLQTNPYSMNTQMNYSSNQQHIAAPILAQSQNIFYPVPSQHF